MVILVKWIRILTRWNGKLIRKTRSISERGRRRRWSIKGQHGGDNLLVVSSFTKLGMHDADRSPPADGSAVRTCDGGWSHLYVTRGPRNERMNQCLSDILAFYVVIRKGAPL